MALPSASGASAVESPGKMETNAFCDHTAQQHGLCSAGVAADVSSSFPAAAGGIARLSASPGELYILTGQFAAGDKREYKYGLDITHYVPGVAEMKDTEQIATVEVTLFASSELQQEC